jgi:DNA polymerase-3 subunit alpha
VESNSPANLRYIHFRTQSSYSLLESSLKIEDIIRLTSTNRMTSVCLADRNNLFASLEFAMAAVESKIQPIHGIILNVLFSNKGKKEFAEILLIAKDKTGYLNLLQLASFIYTKNDRSICNHITFADLSEHNDGLIVLSAYADGVIGRLLLENSRETAVYAAKKLKEIFGNRFYFEIMRHGYAKEKQIESEYLKIASQLEIPLLATNHVVFTDISMHEAHDVLLCISQSVVREEQKRKRVSNQCYFKSVDEMVELFKDLPEAIENTVHLATRCYVMAETSPPSLPNFSDGTLSEEELLRRYVSEGLEFRLNQKFIKEKVDLNDQQEIKQQYIQRLEYELNILCTMNFSGYFLIVSDFIKWSKAKGIAVGPGRGSGAGSVVAWLLQITDLDPIKFGLLFERFLNPERISMPDFDIDFCQERREEVISYVRSKYGDERVGQIITFGKMQAKAVIKDVSRVLGLNYRTAEYLTELVPFNAVHPVTLSQAMNDVAELKAAAAGKGLYTIEGDNELIKQVLSTSLVLEGLHRHSSTHAAGVVIANQDLTKIVPVYKDINSDMLVVQYSMKYAEAAGLVKIDLLGLQTLTVITKTLGLLGNRGIKIDIDTVPYDDKATYDMLSQGLSTGVFQFESVGMKNALRKLGPDNIHDIIALGALYRPGPMDNIPTFIACKHGLQEVDYLHPLLEPILKFTYGVIVYQEQVMEIARVLAGYSLGSADLLRRAMGKKVKSEMDAQEEIFVSGAVSNNVSANQAKSIFATVAKFAGYGFNKAHASAYGVISYQTAYLKANFPTEFLVASLNLDIDNSDKMSIFLQEAKMFHIKVISPDINKSDGLFSIEYNGEERAIIFAFGAIKNVTSTFGKMVVQERSNNGDFKSIIDFAERIDPKIINRRLLENIVKAGCFDKLHSNRNALIQSVPKILAYCASYHLEQKSNQFSLISVEAVSSDVLVSADEFPSADMAFFEFDVLGLFLKNHPLSGVMDSLEKCGIKNSNYIKEALPEGSYQYKLAGVITKKDARMSQRGRFVTLILSDPDGIFEVTIYNDDVFKNYANLINVKEQVVVTCDVLKDKGGLRLTASRFATIDSELQGVCHEINLYPENKDELEFILSVLQQKINKTKNNSLINLFVRAEGDFVAKVNMPACFYLEEKDLRELSQ